MKQDLLFAKELATRLLAADSSSDDPVLVDAMWRAAAIAYRRCFRSGKSLAGGQDRQGRVKLPENWTAGLDEKLQASHDRLLANADKHIAHRVGSEEQARVVLYLEPGEPRGVSGHGVLIVKQVLPTELPPLLIQLAEALLLTIERAQARVGSDLMASTDQMSANEIDALYDQASSQ